VRKGSMGGYNTEDAEDEGEADAVGLAEAAVMNEVREGGCERRAG